MYKWMKEHKRQRNQMLLVGVAEICICILFFTWYAKGNDWYVNKNALADMYDFFNVYIWKKETLNNINTMLSLIVTISGMPIILIIKKLFHITEKIDVNQYWIIRTKRDTKNLYKCCFLAYAKLFVGIFEWIVPFYIFKYVVDVMEQIFKIKKQLDVIDLSLIFYSLFFTVIIVICLVYIITRKVLYSVITLLIYCLCISGFVICALIKTSIELRLIVVTLSILLSGVALGLLHKLNVVKVQASLRGYMSLITRDIISFALLVNIIFFEIPYFLEIMYIVYVLILSTEVIHEELNNEKDLKNIYISFSNEDTTDETRMAIRKIGDMVMYTTMDKVDKLVDYKSVKNIRYSRQLSPLEKVQYRKIAGQHLIYADLNGIRVSADKYRIKNDWIYFYNIYNGEIRANVYNLSDCITLCDKTKLTETD